MNTGKLISVMTKVLAFYTVFAAGMEFQKSDWLNFGYFALLSAFWIFLSYTTDHSNRQMAKLDKELAEAKANLDKSVEKLLEDVTGEGSEERKLAETLHELMHEFSPEGELPTVAELEVIESEFHDRTGHYARLTPSEGGVNATISKIALAARDEVQDAPAASKPATKIPVKEIKDDAAAKREKRRQAGIKGAANRKAKLAKAEAAAKRANKKG